MKIFCTRCGSRNHRAIDCSAPDQKLSPPAEATAMYSAPIGPVEPPPMFEPKPRWPSAPLTCTFANRLAFKTKEEIGPWREKNCPGCKMTKAPWLCDACKHFHYDGTEHAPTGGTSGTSRENTLPVGFQPFIRKSTRETTKRVEAAMLARLDRGVGGLDLPPSAFEDDTAEAPAVEQPKKVVAQPKQPAVKSANAIRDQDSLF